MIKFSAKMRKVGGSWVVTIPYDFVKHGNLQPTKELKISIEV